MEVVAAIIILGLVVTGVAQFLLVSKINVYTDNVKTGVLQALSDTIVKCQTMSVGETNIPVGDDLLPPLLERHQQAIELIRSRAEERDGTIFFDITDQPQEGYNKFIPYYL